MGEKKSENKKPPLRAELSPQIFSRESYQINELIPFSPRGRRWHEVPDEGAPPPAMQLVGIIISFTK
jgi:hypothetical protein